MGKARGLVAAHGMREVTPEVAQQIVDAALDVAGGGEPPRPTDADEFTETY